MNYHDSLKRRLASAARRKKLCEDGWCVNGEAHGKATHGVRCQACFMVRTGRAKSRQEALGLPAIPKQPKRTIRKGAAKGSPWEEDQTPMPIPPNLKVPGQMHSCAVCGDYGRCHLTQLDIGGPTFWICVRCNSETVVPKDDFRGHLLEDDDDSGDVVKAVHAGFKRVVPERLKDVEGWNRPFGKDTTGDYRQWLTRR